MMFIRNLIFFALFFNLVNQHLVAQKTAIYQNPEAEFQTATDLYGKEKFGAAQQHFQNVISVVSNPFSPLRINAEYYDAICALELNNNDGAYKLDQFAVNHPTNTRINLVNFQLGKLSYKNRKYRDAIDYFELVSLPELSSADKQEYFFKLGYSYFKREEYQKAKTSLEKVSQSNSKYSSPASYFLAHLAYVNGNYDEALNQFKSLEQDPNFMAIAPYYIVQILFLQEEYSQVIEMAPPLLVNATPKRKVELLKVLGESYFNTRQYKKALPYLVQFHQSSHTSINAVDYYSLGYCYYVNGDFEEAAKYFQKTTGQQDALAQFAYYYLGSSYLATDQKQFAVNAFKSAYKLPFDREIREDALFKQAQLAFELSYDPYSEAVKALKSYLKAYPDSKRSDEAYNFLFNISVATRNFKDAQDALENIQVKGVDYKKSFQKITFYRGIELFNQFNYEEAAAMFKKAVEYDQDKSITDESIFWMAESFYRSDNLWGAKKYYLEFLSGPKAKKLQIYNMAHYNLGYVYFKKEEYNGAIYHFNQFISGQKDEEPVLIADAYLRLGDSWFINKNYDNALEFYDKVIKVKAVDVDYAMMKKAKALGVLQRYPEQIQTLNKLVQDYPSSVSISEVYFELANTYLITGDNENALINFKKVASSFPNSTYAVKSRLKSGLIYYNSNLNDLAIKTFKSVVTDFPDTPESMEALRSLRSIYVETGNVDEFLNYTNSLSFANITVSEQDSLTYVAAENFYMDEKYDQALTSFENYTVKFPSGAHLLAVHYYLAECYVKNDQKPEALENYNFVTLKPKSEFTERSLIKAADLSFKLGDHAKSLEYFIKLETVAESRQNLLEAWYGQMKNNYILGNKQAALPFAVNILKEEKLSDEMKLEAMIIKANAHLEMEDVLLAKSQFKEIVAISPGAAGAEAKYKIAQIEYGLNDLDNAEKTVFELINGFASYDYWVASGFILLSDIYVSKDNLYQAKQTLKSIIDNFDGDELKQVAIKKLDDIIAKEDAAKIKQKGTEAGDSITIDSEMIELEEY
ncbi:MAG: tetratricopeptide repeat protein [Bacteroidales bacterium]|nr:tetratricopeptide repeat protein [Bacteroidales bacterium]